MSALLVRGVWAAGYLLLGAILAVWYGVPAFSQQQDRWYVLAAGKVGGTEQEAQECVFPIGPAAAVLLHPKGEPCVRMRELIGGSGLLVWVPDP